MVVQLVRVDWRGQGVDGTLGSFTFDDIQKINIKKDSDIKASKASITLQNSIDRFRTGFNQPFTKYNADANDIRFREGDTIKIYAAEVDSFRGLDVSTTSADLIMTGEISEVNVKGGKTAPVKLTVIDKTYVILNRLYSFAYTKAAAINAPEMVQDVIRFVTDDVDSDELSYDTSGNAVSNGVYAVDARLVSAGTTALPAYIDDTRIDGSAFPDLAMAKVAKPAYEWIKDLSSLDSTNDFAGSDNEDAPTQDRNMLFYIDELNRFHWFYPKGILTTTLDGAINSSVTSITLTDASSFPNQGVIFIGTERIDYLSKSGNVLSNCSRGANNTYAASHSDGDNVRNAISLIEGDTSSGYTVLDFNLTKKTFDIVNFVIFNSGPDLFGNGIQSYFFDRATKSKTLKDTYKSYNDISNKLIQEELNAGRLTENNAVTSPFTFKGNRYVETTGDYGGGAGITTAWGTVVTDDDEYNAAVRAQSIIEGKRRAKALTNKRGSPRWKGTVELKFGRFFAGDLLEFTSTRAGLNKQSLRVNTVQYNLTKTGAFVTLSVEEDEERLLA